MGVKHKIYNVIDVNLVLILHLYSACKMYKIAHTCMHLQMFIATLTSQAQSDVIILIAKAHIFFLLKKQLTKILFLNGSGMT